MKYKAAAIKFQCFYGWQFEVLTCFSKAQSRESDEKYLEQVAADACIWSQSFHVRENNLTNSESFKITYTYTTD